jgi:hypothetical protein
MATNLVPWLPGMAFGAGVNSLNGEVKGDAVNRTSAEPPLDKQSQEVHLFMSKIESLEDLLESLDISVEAEGRYGLVSGSARFNFAKQTKVTEYNVYFLIRVTVVNGFQRMRDVTLKGGGPQTLLKDGKFREFQDAYGDAFVSGMQLGGQFYSLLEFHTRSQSEKEKISAGLSVSYNALLASAKISAEINKGLERTKTSSSLSLHVHVEGGDPAKPVPSGGDIDALLKYASTFPLDVARHGKEIAVSLMPYRSLDLPTPPNFVSLDNQRDSLRILLAQRNADLALYEKIDFILQHSDQFDGVDRKVEDDLKDRRKKLSQRINTVTRQAAACADHPDKCQLPEGMPEVPVGALPERKKGQAEDPIDHFCANDIPSRIRKEWFTTKADFREVAGWRIQEYTGTLGPAAIYHHVASGKLFEVHGWIYGKYVEQTTEQGPLGFPTSNEKVAKPGGGYDRISLFEHGNITWVKRTPADFNRDTQIHFDADVRMRGIKLLKQAVPLTVPKTTPVLHVTPRPAPRPATPPAPKKPTSHPAPKRSARKR